MRMLTVFHPKLIGYHYQLGNKLIKTVIQQCQAKNCLFLIRTINLKRVLYFDRRHFLTTFLQVTFIGFMKNSYIYCKNKIATFKVTLNKIIVHVRE